MRSSVQEVAPSRGPSASHVVLSGLSIGLGVAGAGGLRAGAPTAAGRRPADDRHRRRGHGQVPRATASPRPSATAPRPSSSSSTRPGGSLDATQRHRRRRSSRRRSRSSSGSRRPAASRRAPARSSRSPRTSPSWRPGRSIGAASPVSGQGEDIGGTIGEKVIERRDREDHRRSPRSAAGTSTGRSRPSRTRGRHRPSEAVDARRRRRDRRDDRGGPRVRRTARTVEVARRRPVTLDLAGATVDRADDEPVPVVHPAPVRPDHRVPAVQPRLGRAARRALQPELRDRHPRRAGDHPRVHRPRARCR